MHAGRRDCSSEAMAAISSAMDVEIRNKNGHTSISDLDLLRLPFGFGFRVDGPPAGGLHGGTVDQLTLAANPGPPTLLRPAVLRPCLPASDSDSRESKVSQRPPRPLVAVRSCLRAVTACGRASVRKC